MKISHFVLFLSWVLVLAGFPPSRALGGPPVVETQDEAEPIYLDRATLSRLRLKMRGMDPRATLAGLYPTLRDGRAPEGESSLRILDLEFKVLDMLSLKQGASDGMELGPPVPAKALLVVMQDDDEGMAERMVDLFLFTVGPMGKLMVEKTEIDRSDGAGSSPYRLQSLLLADASHALLVGGVQQGSPFVSVYGLVQEEELALHELLLISPLGQKPKISISVHRSSGFFDLDLEYIDLNDPDEQGGIQRKRKSFCFDGMAYELCADRVLGGRPEPGSLASFSGPRCHPPGLRIKSITALPGDVSMASCSRVELRGKLALLSMMDGLLIFDVSNTRRPRLVAHAAQRDMSRMVLDGSCAFLLSDSGRAAAELLVYNLARAEKPKLVSRNPLTEEGVHTLAAAGQRLWLAGESLNLYEVDGLCGVRHLAKLAPMDEETGFEHVAALGRQLFVLDEATGGLMAIGHGPSLGLRVLQRIRPAEDEDWSEIQSFAQRLWLKSRSSYVVYGYLGSSQLSPLGRIGSICDQCAGTSRSTLCLSDGDFEWIDMVGGGGPPRLRMESTDAEDAPKARPGETPTESFLDALLSHGLQAGTTDGRHLYLVVEDQGLVILEGC